MSKQPLKTNDWQPNIAATKTRQEFCDEYRIRYKVFMGKLNYHGIVLPPGLITPKYQMMIYDALGVPPPPLI